MNDDEMTALITSLALKKELRIQILGEARALYSQQYPMDHMFDVITMKRNKNDGSGSSGYESQLILYPTGAHHGEWTALLRSKGECEDPVDAMADLLEKMYSEVGKLVDSY
ncbi:hypothetical protein E8E13_008013 [Curvularia kusanoi]|uniref:Uncharacterized protein n=1 Tax=Curvularia kusanoi TaxID=90978 RepID=A0A9P4W5J2_CURKU|nr:hypothetical protein E8E13_008013 [Curvularia kusanoi]